MPYGQIISEFRHYDYTDKKSVAITPTSAILKLLNNNEQPPSYSAVLAEKSKQEQYDKTVTENQINNIYIILCGLFYNLAGLDIIHEKDNEGYRNITNIISTLLSKVTISRPRNGLLYILLTHLVLD